MYSKQIVKNCANASFIRKMFEKGLELAKQYGPENVYDFSIGNPFAEPPVDLRERMKELVDQPGVHRYMLVSQMYARRWQHFIARVLKSQSLLAILS